MKEAQQRANLAQQRIQGFLEKQQEELLAFLKMNELTTIAGKQGYTLHKLPLWGISNVPENEINFDWPTAQDVERLKLKKMPKLTGMTFFFKDSNTVCLRGLQFEHENDINSPCFETGDQMTCQIKVRQDTIDQTREVTACCRET